ncbi:MAG: hypothetical protein Q8J62_05745 [Candidatus Cloacimonadaceae bacterium]|nr:hypothetical protein [Candidatus Cloacimonadaceae bacterium]
MTKLFLILACTVLLLAACSEKDKPTDTNIYGYKLDQFVRADTVRAHVDANAPAEQDFRSLFAYEIVSSADGFSPRASSNAGYDLPWSTFREGFLVPVDSYRTWFPTFTLPSAFKVNNTGFFRLYRKIDVDNGLHGTKMVELLGLPAYNMDNWEGVPDDAIKLADLLQGIAVYDSVMFVAADAYSKTYQPQHINDGYYFLDSEISTFPNFNAAMPNSLKKFKKLSSIVVYGATSAQNHAFPLAPQSLADLVFTVPASLEGFERTIMNSTRKR